jgi:hypothetical protein
MTDLSQHHPQLSEAAAAKLGGFAALLRGANVTQVAFDFEGGQSCDYFCERPEFSFTAAGPPMRADLLLCLGRMVHALLAQELDRLLPRGWWRGAGCLGRLVIDADGRLGIRFRRRKIVYQDFDWNVELPAAPATPLEDAA